MVRFIGPARAHRCHGLYTAPSPLLSLSRYGLSGPSRVPHSLKAAILCVGVVTVTPYLFPYDFCILSIAVAFLVYDGLSRGFLLGERTTILICFFSLFLFLGAFAPTGSVVCAVMLFLIALRIVAYRGDALAVPLPSRAEVDHPPL